jgi:molybdopterin converting factor small subunit
MTEATAEQITVTVKLFANLRKYGPAKTVLTIPANSPIKYLFDRYNIPQKDRRVIILVNSQPHQTEATILNDGDVVAIFPPIGGGFSEKLFRKRE